MDITPKGVNEKQPTSSSADLESVTASKWTDGIQIDELDDCETVVAQTANTAYEITVIHARTGDVLVSGGKRFPEGTRAQIIGASCGGPTAKVFGIYVGMSIEFLLKSRRVVTSPVLSVKVLPKFPKAQKSA